MAKKATTTAPTTDDLQSQLDAKQQDLLQARRSHASGELVNPRIITTTRKEIARLKTALRQAEIEATVTTNAEGGTDV